MTTAPEIEDVLALSPLQEGLFALYRLAEDSIDLYTMQLRVDIDGPADVEVAAGDSARLAVNVGSDACADLSLEAHLISPWGTWEWIGPATVGAVLPTRGTVELGFDVTPPAWVERGEWWALVRVGCAGRLVYSPAARVTVR